LGPLMIAIRMLGIFQIYTLEGGYDYSPSAFKSSLYFWGPKAH